MPRTTDSKPDTGIAESSSLTSGIEGPEPIAIIGIGSAETPHYLTMIPLLTKTGCRLPGDVNSASECWDFLQAGRSSQGEFPRSRFNIDGFYSSRKFTPGTLPMRGGYFLNQDIRYFDNGFFGINNLEATHMDPQQRNLLEVVYECLESSGTRLEDVAKANVGCFVGDFVSDFTIMQSKDDEDIHRYSATGKGRTLLSNRISHAFDFRGPSMTIDTACSSSLHCLHLACRALLGGDCNSAVVASANLIQSPEQQMDVAASGVLSSSSTCHTFDASADGYGRADAVGALFLKRLTDAIRDNDPIRSLIRATSTNSNGKTSGITSPSASSQEAVIRKAYQFANLNPIDTQYFECHGTGTSVGDPIEVLAVNNAIGSKLVNGRRVFIGSTKPSFGHSEAASGITSIIKATLALEHIRIPATVGVNCLNPKIPWSDYSIRVVQTLSPWPELHKLQVPRISVNSFGYGGANAHCILDKADKWIEKLTAKESQDDSKIRAVQSCERSSRAHEQAFLLPLSAGDVFGLDRRFEAISSLKIPKSDLINLAYTLAERRSFFEWRGFAVVRHKSWEEDLQQGNRSTLVQITGQTNAPLAFVFTGQGAAWPQMGRQLFESYSVFRNSILQLERHLLTLPDSLDWSLSEAIFEGTDKLTRCPSVMQTICTALQIALVDLLRSWNILPKAVLGHSSGEIAAAYAAGHISSTCSIEVAYYRGLAVSENAKHGSMIAVPLNAIDAQAVLEKHKLFDSICIACYNSPGNVTLSGDEVAIDRLLAILQQIGVRGSKLKTGGQAYHSHYMRSSGAAYESRLQNTLCRSFDEDSTGWLDLGKSAETTITTDVPMISSVFGQPVTSEDTTDPGYWRANLESPVLFQSAVEYLSSKQRQTFIEIGPHHTLQLPIQQTEVRNSPNNESSMYLSALVRGECAEQTILSLVGQLWTHGYDVDFEAVRFGFRWNCKTKPRVLHDLPNYPWNHSQLLWKEPRASIEYRKREWPRDEFIGSLIPGGAGRTSTWRGLLDYRYIPWLVDHKLGNEIVLPGACYISMAIRACHQLVVDLKNITAMELRNVQIEKVMILKADSPVEVFIELSTVEITINEDQECLWKFTIMSWENGKKVRHANGTVEALYRTEHVSVPTVARAPNLQQQSKRLWYSRFRNEGLNFGAAFQSMEKLYAPRDRRGMFAEAEVHSVDEGHQNEYRGLYPFDIHPIIVDAAFQTGLIATAGGDLESLSGRVPVRIDRLRVQSSDGLFESSYRTRASARVTGPGAAVGQCEILDQKDETILQIQNAKVVSLQALEIEVPTRMPMLQNTWIVDHPNIDSHSIDSGASIDEFSFTCSSSSDSKEGLLGTQDTENLLMITDCGNHPLELALQRKSLGQKVSIAKLSDISKWDVSLYSTFLVTVELDRAVLANATAKEFTSIQAIISKAARVLWVTNNDFKTSQRPEQSVVLGLARSVMIANPTITFSVLGIDNTTSHIPASLANIHKILDAQKNTGSDIEYSQRNGLLYVSRLMPAETSNQDFEQKKRRFARSTKLEAAGPCELQIRSAGQFETLEFRTIPDNDDIPPDYVQISVRAVSMNAKDMYTLCGKVDTIADTCSCEFAGVVIAIGTAVKDFKIGERVVSSAPGRYRTLETVPASVCLKLDDTEEFTDLACVPMAYGTALHALRNLAKLQTGESILIHSAAGGVGAAAIRIAQSIGAKIYATVGNEEKKRYLMKQFGLDEDSIFNSRNTKFLPALLQATQGTGVDVVLNSLTGARLHASLEACAKFGRFIEIGKRDILDAGNLNMQVFIRGITFAAFDLHELYYSPNPKHRQKYEQLLVDAVQCYRSINQSGDHTTTFDISEIDSAFRYFANSSRIGKIVITYNNPSSLIPLVPPKFTTRFSSHKQYLLVGCLGGLGRSVSRYMFSQGARHFTFLGRSGTSRPAADVFVEDLKTLGANINVIKGDVCSMEDVEKAVSSIRRPLGGVIQAAIGLSEALFSEMSHQAWHTALDPKIRGTWNLHEAISAHEPTLDFFLMTSSIAGTIGFSTEANYCAANTFLDHFSSFRRGQGLKASSVALGPVAGAGIVHDNPEIENVFFRGGITEISEDDMLCTIDVALSRQDELGHVITGLEWDRPQEGFEDSWEMLANDRRLTYLINRRRRAVDEMKNSPTSVTKSVNGIDSRILAVLGTSTPTNSDIDQAIHTILSEQLGRLVLMDAAKIGIQMYLSDFGMDSTLAAQFRTYIFRTTGIDVSFVMLMDAKSRMIDLVMYIRKALLGRK